MNHRITSAILAGALAVTAAPLQTVFAENEETAEVSAVDALNARISALPASMLNSADVSATIQEAKAIQAEYAQLTEEEQALVTDYAKTEELLNGNSDTLNPENYTSDGSLEGKTVGYLGSSITYGYASDGVAFAEYIAAKTGSTSIKQAISGGPLAQKAGVRDEISYITQLQTGALKPEEDLDALVVQLSTNDAALGIELGEISDSYVSDDQDVTTIMGAMEYIISYAKETWDCPVLFYINPYLTDEMVAYYAEGYGVDEDAIRGPYVEVYGEMIDALYSLQSKWEIGVVDLWNNEAYRTVDLDTRIYMMNDPIHPKKSGYAFWYTDAVAEGIKEALNVESKHSLDLTEAGNTYTYSAKNAGFNNDLSGATDATYYVFAGEIGEEEAEILLDNMAMADVVNKNCGNVVVVRPSNHKNYTEEDAAAFPALLGAAVSNAKVIGINSGATFVNNYISQKCYAVAGIMTYGGTMNEGLSYNVPVPAYLSNPTDTAVSYYVQANNAAKVSDTLYQNADNKLQTVALGKDETLAEAFANAWNTVFSKNYRQDNLDTEFYMTTAETHTHPYELIAIADFDALGIQYKPHYSEPMNGAGEYTWFEYVPASVNDKAAGTVPLVISLHGNGNDARLQAETTGWAELAAEEGFILACPEWQDIVYDSSTHEPGPNAFNCDGLEREKLIEWVEMLKKNYPQIDATRIYLTGLSAGASASTLYGALYEDYFAGIAAVSGPGVDKDELTEVVKTYEGHEMPYLYVCGDHDFFGMLPVDGSSTTSLPIDPEHGVYIQHVDANCNMFPFIQAYQKINGLTVSETYDMSLNPYYGVALDNTREFNLDYKTAVDGTLSNEFGEVVRLCAIKDQAHWNYKAEAAYIWEFWRPFSRDLETGILRRNGVLDQKKTDDTKPSVEPKPNTDKKPSAKTSDSTQSQLWFAMTIASAGLAALLIALRQRFSRN